MMKTNTSLAALIALAGMQANAVTIREDSAIADYLEPAPGLFAQTTAGSSFETKQGMCTDSQGRQYDYFETNGIRHGWGGGGHISVDQCQQDCEATPLCVGIQYSNAAGRCGLRVEDGAIVTLSEYETPWYGAAGSGPVASAIPAGDWTCGVNPNYGFKTLQGMCTDSQGRQYDYFETNGIRHGWGGGGHISVEQCQSDCLATPQCVGIQYSTGAGRCGLRVEDGAQVTLPEYETPWNVAAGVGPVASAIPAGDWKCGVKPTAYNPIKGMCKDSQGRPYDHWETNGVSAGWGQGGKISMEQCEEDCSALSQCVGFQYSYGAKRCALRVEDGAQVTLPSYEPTQVGYNGVGKVAGANVQGDWMCYAKK